MFLFFPYSTQNDCLMGRAWLSICPTLEIFMTMKIQVVILWVVRLCDGVVGFQRLGELCCPHL